MYFNHDTIIESKNGFHLSRCDYYWKGTMRERISQTERIFFSHRAQRKYLERERVFEKNFVGNRNIR